ITAIAGQPVKPEEFWKLDDALQTSNGKPIPLTITDAGANTRQETIRPYFIDRFGNEELNFAGMVMRTAVHSVQEDSPAKDQLKPGDIILAVADPSPTGDRKRNPTPDELKTFLNQA